MSSTTSGRQTATVVTNTRVRDGHDKEFEAWQARMNDVISRFDGFVSREVLPPAPPDQLDWVIIQRFERPEQLKAWLESPERATMVDQIEPALEGDDAVNVFVGHEAEESGPPGPVTAVIMTNVAPGHETEFERWHARVKARQSTYPGFLGCEVQPPTGTFQQEWVTLLRFDSNEHLDNWLESDERKELLREADEIIDRSSERRARTSFEGWFKFGADDKPLPSWKQAAIVLLCLFPVVMLEITLLNPVLAWMNVAPATFIANVISVGVLTWPLIPLASRAMQWWLSPRPGAGPRVRWCGPALLVCLYAVSIVFFHFFANWVHIAPIKSV
jgi:antibiotic biosynthesis monooxygenase (ABM) superfamily enzyme